MNPAVVLALLSNVYEQLMALTHENERLRAQLAKHAADDAAEDGVPHYAHEG